MKKVMLAGAAALAFATVAVGTASVEHLLIILVVHITIILGIQLLQKITDEITLKREKKN
ncbi:hypothetical protein [Streptococcus dysgalactiae]|uniref:Uncharacterized protein n=1 Tax=Streptococcus dysgalactiae TaxID=1334 RepID=A0AAE9ZZX4_STRDY|nr:hypothetical protein [Streptococcus dysgalactiae]QGH03339.1 hypothetical protein EA458_01715 [Streptococcus dysgalactiae subsp. dysgalactiae]WAI92481.1 hypothetical protein MP619_08200 [Streptococcus dysgalactiae]WCE86952.1 hypothetical protein PMN45_05040 [Streptococcus dysgalactiae]WCN26949.1 hypothetical protein PP188_05050 [Streptococcus dysgalactiae]BBE40722.1 hypothetical protein FGCSD_1497 [Streptococcus dysgalactiae]